MELKRIYNQTAVTQSIAWRGVQQQIKAYEELMVEKEVAEAFLERCEGFVIEAPEEFATVSPAAEPIPMVWLANMTGNPDAPDQIETRIWKDKQWQWAMAPNPIKHPLYLKERHGITQKEYTARDGVVEALNIPGKTFGIPPYQRVEFTLPVARWFTSRSMLSSPQTKTGTYPKVMESRRPSSFEPDMSWDLNSMLAYLKFVDPDCKRPRDEGTVRKMAGKKKNEEELKQLVVEEKRLVMRKLYFRLVDPQYRLPSRNEFESYLRGPEATEAVLEDVTDEKLLEAALKPDVAQAA